MSSNLTPGVTVSRCVKCKTGFFPSRLMCPKCGHDVMEPGKVHEAVVEETTVVRHAAGQENWTPKHLATVRTPEAQMIVVGLEGPVAAGTLLKLYEQGHAPYGRLS